MMLLKRATFTHEGKILKKYSCGEENVSPELRQGGAPSDTRSFVLAMESPDAPCEEFLLAMPEHVLTRAELTGLFERGG